MNRNTRKACEKRVRDKAANGERQMRVGSVINGQRITKTMKARYNSLVKPAMKRATAMCSMTLSQKKREAKKIFSNMLDKL